MTKKATSFILLIISILLLFPFIWLGLNSFKPATAVITTPPDFSLTNLTIANYYKLFSQANIFKWTFNSILVAFCGVFGNVIICSMAGYSFAKKQIKGKNIFFWLIMSVMMTSTQIIMVPLFIEIKQMNLYNTYLGLILPILVSPYSVFLSKQFIQTIPNELIASARIDGASELGIYVRIIVPLSKPVLAIIAINSFIAQWNDFLWPLLITNTQKMRTLQVGVASMQQQDIDYGLILSAALYTMLPIVILFVSLQKFFVKGMTIGALKG